MTDTNADATERAGGCLLTEREASILLGISEATLARERKRGNIEAIRPGGHLVRYERGAIAAYKERWRQTCPSVETATAALDLAASAVGDWLRGDCGETA